LLNEVSIPSDENLLKKEVEQVTKYGDLPTEVQRMCNVKVKVIPIIMGATGRISRSLRKYLEDIPGVQSSAELEKTVILGAAHIPRKILTEQFI
jgi:hypothetical protein